MKGSEVHVGAKLTLRERRGSRTVEYPVFVIGRGDGGPQMWRVAIEDHLVAATIDGQTVDQLVEEVVENPRCDAAEDIADDVFEVGAVKLARRTDR